MSEKTAASPPVLPFIIADVLFLVMAGALLAYSHRPLLWWEAGLIVACGAAAAWCLITPFLRRDDHQESAARMSQGLAQATRLADLAGELQKLEQLAAHIHSATGQWKAFEVKTADSLEAARQLSETFTGETRAFAEALLKSNDNEKTHLRVEVDKLRRAEGEWLQTLIRVLDHVFALSQAAQRTGQRSLIEQIALFQESCREAARRVGLVPVAPRLGEAYDPRAHQLLDNVEPPAGALVGAIVATGFTYQGQPIRRAFVGVQPASPPAEKSQQDDLAFTEEAKP